MLGTVIPPRRALIGPSDVLEKFEAVKPGAAGDDTNRLAAWVISVTTSIKESAPEEKRCRHIRAAGAKAHEIRTVAFPKSAVWSCLESAKQADLAADFWPTECDLCGAETVAFSSVAGKIPGCVVHLQRAIGKSLSPRAITRSPLSDEVDRDHVTRRARRPAQVVRTWPRRSELLADGGAGSR